MLFVFKRIKMYDNLKSMIFYNIKSLVISILPPPSCEM